MPVSLWHVGNEFGQTANRVVFVGKTAVNGQELTIRNGVRDASERGRDLFASDFSGYWTYTKEIASSWLGIGPMPAIEYVAVTNMVKCNASDGAIRKDQTLDHMRETCADRLGIVWAELEILKPRRVVFMTGENYDEQIGRYLADFELKEVTTRSHRIAIGQKQMLWWHRRFGRSSQETCDILRIGHPERLKKEKYVELVAAWLREG